jgi:hypothetical protein
VDNAVTASSSFPSPPERAASILPLRGSRTHAPSSVLVRARLADGLEADRVRAAVALFAEVCDETRSERGVETRWWSQPVDVRVGAAAAAASLPLGEAEAAFADLVQAGLLTAVERGHLIEADALCECPALDCFDWDVAKSELRQQGRLVGPAIAVLREVLHAADQDGVLTTTIPRLLDATLYGRTRLTQALGLLEHSGMIHRGDLPNRMVRLQLVAERDRSRSPTSPPSRATPPAPSSHRARMRLPTNAPLEIAGEPIEVAPGIVPELELGPDGRYYLWLGPVRVGPYEV